MMSQYGYSVKKILDKYTLPQAKEETIQQTIRLGKEILPENPVHELGWARKLINQFRYISLTLWLTELLALGLAVYIISQVNIDSDITTVLSSLSFIIALIGVLGFPELCKSFSYQMWELEHSCKYNLKQIVALKLFIIGTLDLLILITVSVLMSVQTNLPLWQLALYIFVPFNLTCIISFYIISFSRKKEIASHLYLTGLGFAFILLLCINRFSIYQHASFQLWIIIFVASAVMLITRVHHFLKGVEERGKFLCN